MLQDVLGEGGAVAQLSQQSDQLRVDAVHAGVKGGLFAHFTHLGVQLLFAFLDNVLNTGRVDATVLMSRSRAILATWRRRGCRRKG